MAEGPGRLRPTPAARPSSTRSPPPAGTSSRASWKAGIDSPRPSAWSFARLDKAIETDTGVPPCRDSSIAFAFGFASLFRGDRVDASLKSEIELHLQEQIDENIAAGMSPAEARAGRAPRFRPGRRSSRKQCRDTRRVAFIEHLAQDLRYTLRSLVRQPMLLAAAVVVDCRRRRREHVDLQPRQRADVRIAVCAQPRAAGRICRWAAAATSRIVSGGDLERERRACRTDGLQLRDRASIGAAPDQSISLMPMVVAANFFDVIGPPVAMGRGFTASGGAGRARSGGRRGHVTVLAGRLGGDPQRPRQDTDVQWPTIHGARRAAERLSFGGGPSACRRRSTCRSVASLTPDLDTTR